MQHNIRTLDVVVNETLAQAYQQGSYPVAVDVRYVQGKTADLVDEIRTIITGELARLLDMEGIAEDWNDAISAAIRKVEEA